MRKSALFVLLTLCGSASAWATEFNDQTSCDVLTHSVAVRDVMDVRRSNQYIREALQSFDRIQTAAGHQTLVNLLSVAEMRAMVWEVVTTCGEQPKLTVRKAAAVVYMTSSMFGPS
jgi:hypothetical protein